MSKSNLKRDQKRRGIASRTALSQRNIVEYSISECVKAMNRNKSLRSNALKTDKKLLQKVVCVPPPE
jgi:hypothetical protein